MQKLLLGVNSVALTLWVGGLWVVGYAVAPILFYSLTDRTLAGLLAGKMFGMMAIIGMVCGTYLVFYRLYQHGTKALKQGVFWALSLMLLLTAIGNFGIQPIMESLKQAAFPRDVMESVFRDRFRTWHGVSSVVYLVQSLLGMFAVILQGKSSR